VFWFLTAILPGESRLAGFIETKDDGNIVETTGDIRCAKLQSNRHHRQTKIDCTGIKVVLSYRSTKSAWTVYIEQEAKLMLTNPRDAFRGQSTSPNIVPFHMLGTVSSYAIVTLSFKTRCFSDIRLHKMSW